MSYVLAAVNLLVIFSIAFTLRKKQPAEDRNFFWPALLARLVAGVVLGLVYRYYYYPDGDTFRLFDQSAVLTSKLFDDPSAYFNAMWNSGSEFKGELRSAFFAKILSIVNIFTGSSYWITGLWVSLAVFIASWNLFRVVVGLFDNVRGAAAVGFLFLPSVLFWSSGIIKESLALAGLLVLAASWLKWMMTSRTTATALLADLVALWVVWNLKYYWAAVFVPVALAALIIQKLLLKREGFSRWTIPFWLCLVAAFCFVVSLIHPNFRPEYFLTVLVVNHDAFVNLSADANLIHYYNLHPEWSSILINAPWALMSGLFRPFIMEPGNFLGHAAGAENLVVLILFIAALFSTRIGGSTPRIIVFSILCYTLVLCIFLALSTPNFGSLARYKAGFMPFFISLVVYRNPLIHWLSLRLKKLKGR